MARVAVIGAGWAGLSAAVALCDAGLKPTVFEMSPHPGGRARSLAVDAAQPLRLDNGQHILIGAYTESLALMRRLGVDLDQALWRSPLTLIDANQHGLRLTKGPPLLAFSRAVLAASHWPWAARLSLLRHSLAWLAQGFQCNASLTVARLCRGLHPRVREDLLNPLCVAALNTPAREASAQVFLRVLKDALFSGPGSADLLLPQCPLAELLPEPAWAHLRSRGVSLHLGQRAQFHQEATPGQGSPWRVGNEPFDAVLLACPAAEAARQVQACATPCALPEALEGWAEQTRGLRYEPIITVYLKADAPAGVHADAAALPFPMVALREGPDAPAQFAFDLGPLRHAPGVLALVVSGAAEWVSAGLDVCAEACLNQAQRAFPALTNIHVLRSLAEKRATFACTPGLRRPPARIDTGLWAAGDYVAGPYPATLEGAVRAGQFAARGLLADLHIASGSDVPFKAS